MPLACRAATKVFHSCLFWASCWMVPQVWFKLISSCSTVRRQVYFGLPLLRLPSGVQKRAVRVISLGSLLSKCPIHLHLLLMMMDPMLSCLQWVSNCSLEMVFGQKTRMILLKFFVWKTESFFRSLSVILQHSEPYNMVESTQLWFNFSLVFVSYCWYLQTLFSILNAFLALLRRFIITPFPPRQFQCWFGARA